MKIKSIAIENIKGIQSENFTLDLIPNKPNILVAPNGFGKSSFAIGFDALRTNKIELDDKHYFDNNDQSVLHYQ
jgi:predicted ATP-binding protein involved in virulence